jgi:membrane protein insertase Oxa1/YidC/SpoIIIJ
METDKQIRTMFTLTVVGIGLTVINFGIAVMIYIMTKHG